MLPVASAMCPQNSEVISIFVYCKHSFFLMYTGFEFRVFPHASSYRWLYIFRSFEQIIINYFSIFFLQICYYPQLLLFPLPLPCSWIVPKTNIKEFHLRTESEIDKSQFSFICVQNSKLKFVLSFHSLT